ncbi:MAG: hypothetical protein M3525_07640 [Acidobacteriota bacterium]|nr:hypothetical protein [Acidobacteriota bacterium]
MVLSLAFCCMAFSTLRYTVTRFPFRSTSFSAFCFLSFLQLWFGGFAALVRRRNFILLVACYFGCLFPDLLDLSPAMLNKRTGFDLPVFKAFPWHWHIYSGSIYDGSRQFESNLWHSLMFATSISLLVYFWRRFFRFGGMEEPKRG